jgi:hypothetical protein
MRLIFGVLSLLVVVAVVGVLAKKQLQAVHVPAVGAASAPAFAGTPAQRSQQMQRQASDDVRKALEQGMQRNETEGETQSRP